MHTRYGGHGRAVHHHLWIVGDFLLTVVKAPKILRLTVSAPGRIGIFSYGECAVKRWSHLPNSEIFRGFSAGL
jgi:hypothetical protein